MMTLKRFFRIRDIAHPEKANEVLLAIDSEESIEPEHDLRVEKPTELYLESR